MPFGRGTAEQPYLGDLLAIFINHLLTCHFARIGYLCDLCPNQRRGKTGRREVTVEFHRSGGKTPFFVCTSRHEDDVDDDDDDDDDVFSLFVFS